MRRRRTALTASLAIAGVLLTGCSTSSPVGSRVTSTPGRTAQPAARPASTPTTPPPTQHAEGATRVSVPCAYLVPQQVVAAVGAGYAPVQNYSPAAGSPASRLAAIGGTVCGWRDAGTGHLLEVAVAQPSPDDDLALKNDLVERSNSVPTYGEEAYFQVVDKVGEVDAFPDVHWVFAASPDLYEPGDATGIVNAVGQALQQHAG